MEDWQERVIKEKEELSKKLGKLHTFLLHKGPELDKKTLELLAWQEMLMQHYVDVLTERIELFFIEEG